MYLVFCGYDQCFGSGFIQTFCWIPIRIRIQAVVESGSNPDPDPDQDFSYDKGKISRLKNVIQYWLLKPGGFKDIQAPAQQRSLQTWNFLTFSLLWTVSACLDPDPIRIRNTGEHTVPTGIKHKCSTQNLPGCAYDSPFSLPALFSIAHSWLFHTRSVLFFLSLPLCGGSIFWEKYSKASSCTVDLPSSSKT
jgi:hypothetical protein